MSICNKSGLNANQIITNGQKRLNRSSSQEQIEKAISTNRTNKLKYPKRLAKSSLKSLDDCRSVCKIAKSNRQPVIDEKTTMGNLSYKPESSGNTKTFTDDKKRQNVFPETKCRDLDKSRYSADDNISNLFLKKCEELCDFEAIESTEKIPDDATRTSDQPESKDEMLQFALQESNISHEQTKNDVKSSPYPQAIGHLDDFVKGCTNMVFSKHIDDSLKTNLYKSVDDNNDTECQSLLKSNQLSYILPLLATGLAKAVESGNHKIVNIIHSYIAENSSKILTEFRDKYKKTFKDATVWMGTECICNKVDGRKYEDEMCEQPKPLFIVETDDESRTIKVEEKFHGFLIKVVTDNTIRKNESRNIEQNIMPETQQRLDRVPKSVAKRLFKNHSNLTMVCPSAYKSKGFGTDKFAIDKINCINLFCRIKGIIPIGEHHFPLKINGMLTNVLEGTSYLTSAVHIGDKIYNSKEETGTLGGFVKYYGIDTFLTCAHVIFGKSNIANLQTKDIHFNCHTIRNDDKKEPVKCTLIRHILKYDTEETTMEENDIESAETEEETSVDAALVFIQMPNTSNNPIGDCSPIPDNTASSTNKSVELRIKLQGYGDSTDDNLSALGLRSIYLNENFIDIEVKHSMAIALSAITGKQERFISLSKSNKLSVLVPSHVRVNTNIMYNQFSIQNMDFQPGDSGTCIYSPFTGSDDIGCIGMLVGKSTSGECIVTPMKEILKALEVDSKS
ncbi:uncharacterized protein LOC127712758 [Mytilus californianus]|uniref:uncharacterized protein LOC127712758 n=1 Tax=Mytilus californianus TaxID=6549 RepID=UPI0022465001|nr:uncharacterized protein LOC127712758 [Mytilus californianus]